jgi:hypothetical protein
MRLTLDSRIVAVSFVVTAIGIGAGFALAQDNGGSAATGTSPADPAQDLEVPGPDDGLTVPADPDEKLLVPNEDGGAEPAEPETDGAPPNHVEPEFAPVLLDHCANVVERQGADASLSCRVVVGVAAGEIKPGDYSDQELADAVAESPSAAGE